MSPTPPQFSLRAAERKDKGTISRFLNTPVFTHRHLDWREPLDWLGHSPFWILESNHEIEAVLACPPDPADVAWVRLFAVSSMLSPSWSWKFLFERVLNWMDDQPVRPMITSLGLQDWFSDLLEANSFTHHQDIIVLSYEDLPAEPASLETGLILRKMEIADLPGVGLVDNSSFESIWQLSLDDLTRAFDRSTYKTVMELDGQIVAYQMSAISGFSAHLARLAVLPTLQRRHIGSSMVQDVLHHFINVNGTWGVTLNTQDNNQASLSLYQKIGFHLTGERFPVYVYQ